MSTTTEHRPRPTAAGSGRNATAAFARKERSAAAVDHGPRVDAVATRRARRAARGRSASTR